MNQNPKRLLDSNGKVYCSPEAAILAMRNGNMDKVLLDNNNPLSRRERELFNQFAPDFGYDITIPEDIVIDVDQRRSEWVYPSKYDEIDLREFFLDRCTSDIERERVLMELDLYESYHMTKLLRCMIWVVDTMNEHGIIWGVGRGSSVSSYCLYLLKLHLVDSIKYGLDIHEFLKV